MSNKSFSNILIILCCILTGVSFFIGHIVSYGMHTFFLVQWMYGSVVVQFMLYQFLHGGVFHLLSNTFFLYMFGNQVETMLGRNRFMLFFVLSSLFVGISLLIFSQSNTIGISGFAMAVLAYVFLDLYAKKNPEYRSAGIFLLINMAIGFTGNISLTGHVSGAIFGMLFFFFNAYFRRKNA